LLSWKSDIEFSKASALAALHALPPETPAAGTAILINGCRQFTANAEIFSQYEDVSDVYSVVSGAVRFARLLKDGRRQIGAFYLPGDLFGLESEERHSFSAECIVNSRIGISKRSAFIDAAMRNQAYALQVWTTTAAHLQRAQSHMSVLGRGTAQERLATFLLDMDTRLDSHGSIELPMQRRDIADYLGLTIETISRVFHYFERQKIISIPHSRRVELHARDRLQRLSDA
jgi:CRP/FNR family transcriptional regulator, nitrogen fixation regulation protein